MTPDLEAIAQTLVADGKGILAADETVSTLTKRFDTLGLQSTEQSRRTYREMLFTAGAAEFISGVIMQDETIRQRSSDGMPFAQVLSNQGILPGRPTRKRRRALPRAHGVASLGRYTDQMEVTPVGVGSPPHRREWRDD